MVGEGLPLLPVFRKSVSWAPTHISTRIMLHCPNLSVLFFRRFVPLFRRSVPGQKKPPLITKRDNKSCSGTEMQIFLKTGTGQICAILYHNSRYIEYPRQRHWHWQNGNKQQQQWVVQRLRQSLKSRLLPWARWIKTTFESTFIHTL